MTMSLVSTVTVGSGGAASIEFTSIPQDGTDLLVLVSARSSASGTAATPLDIFVNNTGTSRRTLKGISSTVTSTSTAAGIAAAVNAVSSTSDTFSNTSFYIANYTVAATGDKSISADSATEQNDTTNNRLGIDAYVVNTNAGTSVKIQEANVNTLVQHSTASLYKITKGSDGIVTTS